jgi:hypothetical protein
MYYNLSKREVKEMTREQLIEVLEWNDPNGTYNDEDSILEFGEVMSRDEAEVLVINQFEL